MKIAQIPVSENRKQKQRKKNDTRQYLGDIMLHIEYWQIHFMVLQHVLEGSIMSDNYAVREKVIVLDKFFHQLTHFPQIFHIIGATLTSYTNECMLFVHQALLERENQKILILRTDEQRHLPTYGCFSVWGFLCDFHSIICYLNVCTCILRHPVSKYNHVSVDI